jgi:hypothetical protein
MFPGKAEGPVLPTGRRHIVSNVFMTLVRYDLSEGPLGPTVPVAPTAPVGRKTMSVERQDHSHATGRDISGGPAIPLGPCSEHQL